MHQPPDTTASPYHPNQYYQNPAAADHPQFVPASAPPVSASSYDWNNLPSTYPSFPPHHDHVPNPPQYTFPHLHYASYDHHVNNQSQAPLNSDCAVNSIPSLNMESSYSSNSYPYDSSALPYLVNSLDTSGSYGGNQGGFDGGVFKYNGGRVESGYGGERVRLESDSGVGGGGVVFDDYGRPINVGNSSSNIVKAVPKREDSHDVKTGVQKFRVKLLSEGFGQTDMDVLSQVLDSYIFAFWAKTSVDPEPKRIRLKSNSYTTNNILDLVTAASIQSKEIDASNNPSDLVKGAEQYLEKKRGFIDWKNLIKPVNEEKDHWVPDEAVNKCSACAADFTAFNRKHHCRNCGDIFCDKCTQGRIALTAEDDAQPVRVCDQCMAEVTQRLSNKETSLGAVLHSHEDLARKLQEEMDKKRKTGAKPEASNTRMREVACPTCTVHLQIQVPTFGSETVECSVCQHPFLVSAQ